MVLLVNGFQPNTNELEKERYEALCSIVALYTPRAKLISICEVFEQIGKVFCFIMANLMLARRFVLNITK